MIIYALFDSLWFIFLKIRFEFPTWLHPCASSLNHGFSDSFFFLHNTLFRTVSHNVLDRVAAGTCKICGGTDGCRAVAEADVVRSRAVRLLGTVGERRQLRMPGVLPP